MKRRHIWGQFMFIRLKKITKPGWKCYVCDVALWQLSGLYRLIEIDITYQISD